MGEIILLFLLFGAIGIFFKAVASSKTASRQAKMIKEHHQNLPKQNYFKILPFDSKELKIESNAEGNYRLTFTPTSLRQIEDEYYVITLKAKHEKGDILFELVLHEKAQVFKDEDSGKSIEYSVLVLDTNSKEADRLFRLLAGLFEIELSNKAQVVRSATMIFDKKEINLETLKGENEFIASFLVEETAKFVPGFKMLLDLEKGEFYIEELDRLYRPFIIDRLQFKPNIKN